MSNSYIKFKLPEVGIQKTPDSIGKRMVTTIATTDAPVVNPDFKNQMEKVTSWLIEFEGDSYFPNREIGLDILDQPIIIMPWRKNYGYWTDNNLTMRDFRSHFNILDISKKEFEQNWKLFEKEN